MCRVRGARVEARVQLSRHCNMLLDPHLRNPDPARKVSKRAPTFPHSLVLLGRIARFGATIRRPLVGCVESRLRLAAERAGDLCGPIDERGEVDVHEAQDHVMRDVRDVPGDHVGCVEYLRVP
jgi:hypothetical protein